MWRVLYGVALALCVVPGAAYAFSFQCLTAGSSVAVGLPPMPQDNAFGCSNPIADIAGTVVGPFGASTYDLRSEVVVTAQHVQLVQSAVVSGAPLFAGPGFDSGALAGITEVGFEVAVPMTLEFDVVFESSGFVLSVGDIGARILSGPTEVAALLSDPVVHLGPGKYMLRAVLGSSIGPVGEGKLGLSVAVAAGPAVPEPGAAAVFGLGCLILGRHLRRRRLAGPEPARAYATRSPER